MPLIHILALLISPLMAGSVRLSPPPPPCPIFEESELDKFVVGFAHYDEEYFKFGRDAVTMFFMTFFSGHVPWKHWCQVVLRETDQAIERVAKMPVSEQEALAASLASRRK